MEGDLERDLEEDSKEYFKQDMEGDLLSSSGKVRSRSGLVQVWFSLQLKLDSGSIKTSPRDGFRAIGKETTTNYFGPL